MKNIFIKLVLSLIIAVISGCGTTSNVGYVWFGTGIDRDWGTGGEIWSHFTTHSQQKAYQVAAEYCSTKNLPPPILDPSFKQGEYYKYRFECKSKSQVIQPVQNTPLPAANIGINDAKSKCKDLGFKQGTEQFGNCVLKFTK
jgi:hypothetical protein